MWGAVVQSGVVPAEPVTTAAAKLHMRVEHDADDVLIDGLIVAARAMIEKMTGTRMVTQTVAFKTGNWAAMAQLPVAPISAISAISYIDSGGLAQTLSGSIYEARLAGLQPSVVLKYSNSWPGIQAGSEITVTAVAGYGVAGEQPAEILLAIKMLAAHWYERRESAGDQMAEIPFGVSALIENSRRYLA